MNIEIYKDKRGMRRLRGWDDKMGCWQNVGGPYSSLGNARAGKARYIKKHFSKGSWKYFQFQVTAKNWGDIDVPTLD